MNLILKLIPVQHHHIHIWEHIAPELVTKKIHSGIVDISGTRFFVIYHLNGNHNSYVKCGCLI